MTTTAHRPKATPSNPLPLPIEQDDVAGVTTLGGYLAELLIALIEEGEDFDPKRPLGNSDWQDSIDDALRVGGFPANKQLNAAITAALTGQLGTTDDLVPVRMTIDVGDQRYSLMQTYQRSTVEGAQGVAPYVAAHFADAAGKAVSRHFAQAVSA